MLLRTQSISIYTVLPIDKKYAVCRDGVIMKTPAGIDLALPTVPLAEVIAGEWRSQKEKVQFASMPMMQFAATAIDITFKNRVAIIEELSGYVSADLLCFRAENPEELVLRQQKIWQPVLNWCAGRFDALLHTVQGIIPTQQSLEALQAMSRAVELYDDFQLTGLKQAAEVTGSLVLALALIEQHLTAEQVFHAAELDAHFQTEKWGDDPATANRHASILNDLKLCEQWFELLKSGKD